MWGVGAVMAPALFYTLRYSGCRRHNNGLFYGLAIFMIAQLLRGPHSLYRRYQGLLEQTLTAIGFALLVALTLNHLAVYPNNWVVVIGIGIAVLGIRWPAIAYA